MVRLTIDIWALLPGLWQFRRVGVPHLIMQRQMFFLGVRWKIHQAILPIVRDVYDDQVLTHLKSLRCCLPRLTREKWTPLGVNIQCQVGRDDTWVG